MYFGPIMWSPYNEPSDGNVMRTSSREKRKTPEAVEEAYRDRGGI
jgi:hypothetical protein